MTSPNLDYIAEPLRHLTVPIYDLKLDPENVIKHDEYDLEKTRNSLRDFGQDVPLVVQKQGMIVRKGNGRLIAARQLGWTHIAALVVDESNVRAIARAIADNVSGRAAGFDKANLAKMLQAVKESGEIDVKSTGFSDTELAKMLGEAKGAAGGVERFEIKPPPQICWILLGVPLAKYGEVQQHIAALEANAAISVSSNRN